MFIIASGVVDQLAPLRGGTAGKVSKSANAKIKNRNKKNNGKPSILKHNIFFLILERRTKIQPKSSNYHKTIGKRFRSK